MKTSVDPSEKLPFRTKVRIKDTRSSLDGRVSSILGVSSSYVVGHMYIVCLMENPLQAPDVLDYPYSCVTLPSGCLEKMCP